MTQINKNVGLNVVFYETRSLPEGIAGRRVPFTHWHLPPKDRKVVECHFILKGIHKGSDIHLGDARAYCNPIDTFDPIV